MWQKQSDNALFLIYYRKRLRGTQGDWKNITYKEKGNALFLILIAVALFAALSYAVTQSGRSGGGVDKEQAILKASQFVQYGTGLQTTVQRMTLTGTNVTDLDFGIGFSETIYCRTGVDCPYAPEGGGFTFQSPPIGGTWRHFANDTPGGVDGVGPTANDILIINSGTSLGLSICEQVNKGLDISISPIAFDSDGDPLFIDAYPGEPFACFEYSNGAGNYYYYHVLVEQ